MNQSTSPNSQYKGVLFDLDGTLIDTAPDFIYCLNLLRKEYGLSSLPNEEIRKVVSDGARAMIAFAFAIQEGDKGFEQKRQEFLALYEKHIAVKSQLFEGLTSTLKHCEEKNIPWGIVTNKPRKYSVLLLAALGLDKTIGTLVCADDVENPKPHRQPMDKACSEINLTPEQVIYVGDHKRDIQAGKNANMPTVAAAYGYVHQDDEAQSWNADWLVNSGNELDSLLKELLSSN
jgi:phosphoglycolate phosphatase